MSDESIKWDGQWSKLLTHCHGMEAPADAGFKSRLLDELKAKTARHLDAQTRTDEANADKWGRLMNASYIPCHPDEQFKNSLLGQLKARQQSLATGTAETAEQEPAAVSDDAIQTLLTHSYEPVAPRRDFETRLLDNLKERQRRVTSSRRRFRRRTIFTSAASSIAAAAMVMFVVWAMPFPGQTVQSPFKGNLRLPVPDTALVETREAAEPMQLPIAEISASAPTAAVPVSFDPASFDVVPASFGGYRVADAFAGPALPKNAFALQNIEMDAGGGWTPVDGKSTVMLKPGLRFRASGGMGHVEFADGSMISLSPNGLLQATADGLNVAEGFMLISVPDYSSERFRLHFSERDIAIEPGTDLAVLVEPAGEYAAGGAPAPMVMVVDRPDSPGGLALAKGKTGVGPLLARQIYRLDHYVTPALPSRTLYDTECNDLEKFYKAETVHFANPPASLVGGFATGSDRDTAGYTATVLTPVGFAKQGDRWVAESYGNEPTVKLKYLSDSYFGFANERRDLARALALGSEVVIDGGDGNFYEIVK